MASGRNEDNKPKIQSIDAKLQYHLRVQDHLIALIEDYIQGNKIDININYDCIRIFSSN